jgi:hypothetical protein
MTVVPRMIMNRLLIEGILTISTAPLFAQTQPDPAKLRADAQKVVSISVPIRLRAKSKVSFWRASPDFSVAAMNALRYPQ